MNEREWVIWSFEHDAWWGPGEWGYVRELAAAGRYTEMRARKIVADANIVHHHECAMPLTTAEGFDWIIANWSTDKFCRFVASWPKTKFE
jgi:hypothetical protein